MQRATVHGQRRHGYIVNDVKSRFRMSVHFRLRMRLLILSRGNLFFIHEQAYQIINERECCHWVPHTPRILFVHLSAAAMRTLKIAHAFELGTHLRTRTDHFFRTVDCKLQVMANVTGMILALFPDYPTNAIPCNINGSTSHVVDVKLPALAGTDDFDYVWLIFTILVLVGNSLALLWRCTRRRDQRNSSLSILVINLAAADLLLGIQMLLYMFLTAWPCSALYHPAVVSGLSYLSACLQITSIMMSSAIIMTTTFYFMISWGCRCSPKWIIGILVVEWLGVSSAGCCYVTLVQDDVREASGVSLNSALCLKWALFFWAICNVITTALFVLAFAVMMTVLKRRTPEDRRNRNAGWQIRFMIMAFVSFFSFVIDGPGDMYMAINIYYAQLWLAAKALINSLVFTIASKAFFKSVKRNWIILRYKCGQPLHVLDIHSEEGESQDTLILITATENRIDV